MPWASLHELRCRSCLLGLWILIEITLGGFEGLGWESLSGWMSQAHATPPWSEILDHEDTCADCHPQVVEAWESSPMGRSFQLIDRTVHSRSDPSLK